MSILAVEDDIEVSADTQNFSVKVENWIVSALRKIMTVCLDQRNGV